MENEVKNNSSIKLLLIIIIVLLLVVGGLVTFLILNNDSKNDSKKEENQQVEENKKDENKVEENKVEENKTEENKTEENKTEENKTEENKTKDTTPELSKTPVNKEVSGIKTNVVYEGSKESKEYEDTLEVTLTLTGDGNYNMNYGIIAGTKSAGTYTIKNNKLTLNQIYGGGSDCSITKENKTFTFDIKDGKIILSMFDVKDLELNATDKANPGELFLELDVCEVKSDGMGKMPVSYTYADAENAVDLQILPFNHYLMVYCNEATCASSYGTYKDNNGTVTLTQTKYQGSDSCYYKQNKTFTYTYTKLSDAEIKKIQDDLDTLEYYSNVKINLKNGNINMPDKEFTLTKVTESTPDNDATTFYNSVDFFATYCGQI